MKAANDAPGDHDAGDPHPRADLVHDDVAWDFKEKIADEENACADAVGGFRKAEFTRHLQLGEADIDAVEIGDHVAQHQKGYDAPEDLAIGTVFRGFSGIFASDWRLRLQRHDFLLRLLPRSLSILRGTPAIFGSAAIFINPFWQRCQQQIGSAAKKTLLLGGSSEKWGQRGGRAGRSGPGNHPKSRVQT